MPADQKNRKLVNQDPLHGLTLKVIVTQLVEKYGWEELGHRIKIKCFINEPSLTSSLKFLRKTPWARKEVETLYLNTQWPSRDVWTTASRNNHKA